VSTLTRTPLRRRSDAKRRAQAERIGLVHQYLAEGREWCEIRPWLALMLNSDLRQPLYGPLGEGVRSCTQRLEGLHERRKRSAGGSLTNRQNLIPACNRCNQWVEDHPIEAHRIGLVVRSGDDEWRELAA
jgi:hypothetical protein